MDTRIQTKKENEKKKKDFRLKRVAWFFFLSFFFFQETWAKWKQMKLEKEIMRDDMSEPDNKNILVKENWKIKHYTQTAR